MCWSIQVTVLFLILHLLQAELVRRLNPRYKPTFLVFIYFYAFMELLQLSQWLMGSVNSCTQINKFFTIIAYLLIWLQPVMFSLFGIVQTNKFQYYLYSFFMSIFALLIACLNMFLSYYNNYAVLISSGSNFANETCTYVGQYGHLLWKFPIYSLDIQPSYFVYITIILLCILKYPRAIQLTLGLGWFVTLLVSIYMVKGSAELPSFWCLLSVFADIPIIIFSVIDYFRMRNHAKIPSEKIE